MVRETALTSRQREAYFLQFAEEVRKVTSIPLAVTGGFRTAKGMAEAIEKGATDIVGLARPLAITPDIPNRVLGGEDEFESPIQPRISTGVKFVDKTFMLDLTWYEQQLVLMGQGKPPNPKLSPWKVASTLMFGTTWKSLRRRA